MDEKFHLNLVFWFLKCCAANPSCINLVPLYLNNGTNNTPIKESTKHNHRECCKHFIIPIWPCNSHFNIKMIMVDLLNTVQRLAISLKSCQHSQRTHRFTQSTNYWNSILIFQHLTSYQIQDMRAMIQPWCEPSW